MYTEITARTGIQLHGRTTGTDGRPNATVYVPNDILRIAVAKFTKRTRFCRYGFKSSLYKYKYVLLKRNSVRPRTLPLKCKCDCYVTLYIEPSTSYNTTCSYIYRARWGSLFSRIYNNQSYILD